MENAHFTLCILREFKLWRHNICYVWKQERKKKILVLTIVHIWSNWVNADRLVNLWDILSAVAQAATCLLLQALTAPRAAMLLRSASRRLLSSSGDSAIAIPPSCEITDWEKDETGPYIFSRPVKTEQTHSINTWIWEGTCRSTALNQTHLVVNGLRWSAEGSHLFDFLEHLAALIGRKERVVTQQLQTVGEGRWRHAEQTAGGPDRGSCCMQNLTSRDHNSRWWRTQTPMSYQEMLLAHNIWLISYIYI